MIVKLTPDFIANNLVCPDGAQHIEFVDEGRTGLYIYVKANTPGRGVFYYRFKNANKRTCHKRIASTDDINLREARERVKILKAETTLGKHSKVDEKARNGIPTLTEFMDQYVEHQKQRIRGWSRQRDLFRNHLQPVFGNLRLDAIDVRSVQQFLTSLRNRGYAASTSNHPIRVLCHSMSLAHKWGIIESNKLEGVILLREENQVNNVMCNAEVERLVKVLKSDKNKMVCAVCLFLLSTGARLNEALSARWEHFDLEHRNWTVPSEHSKSRKIRSIPLNQSALQILESLGTRDKYDHAFISRGGMPFTTIHKVWNRLRNDAGLPHLRLHDLRHQYASFLVNSGRSLYEVQQILGHSDPSVTMRYAHLSTKSLQEAADSASKIITGAMPEST